ncbi:hypothetical protein Hanom_Chr02g00139291 [Helianthus anomalus]
MSIILNISLSRSTSCSAICFPVRSNPFPGVFVESITTTFHLVNIPLTNDVFFGFFLRMLSPLAIHHADIKATSSAVSHLVVCGCFSVCCDV